MNLSRNECAALALLDLAEQDGMARIDDTARRKGIPRERLDEILAALCNIGYVKRDGLQGGYGLSLNPKDITIAGIISIVYEPARVESRSLQFHGSRCRSVNPRAPAVPRPRRHFAAAA